MPPDRARPRSRSARRLSRASFQFRTELEDIHMHIERALIERLGDVGRKLHTGRSRNDQVSTDLRLWVRDAIDESTPARLDAAAGVRRPLRTRRRRHPARLHAPAARPAGARRPLLAGLLREARARPRAAGRLPQAREPAAASAPPRSPARRCRSIATTSPTARLRRRRGQQPRRLQRSRLRRSSSPSC